MISLAALVLSFWPVWKWYAARMTDGSDEPWGMLALLTAMLYIALSPKKILRGRTAEIPPPALAVLAIYAAGYSFLPAMARALLALVCVMFALSPHLSERRVHLGLLGLLLLSLPIIASLQFYAGYPLRALTGKIVCFMLAACGEHVVASGTSLLWRGDIISIDAPCSGIKMLWGGLYAAFSLSCFAGLSNYQTWMAYVVASLSIFVANILRTFVLFFAESRIWEMPAWFHTASGLAFFALALGTMTAFVLSMRGRRRIVCQFCETP